MTNKNNNKRELDKSNITTNTTTRQKRQCVIQNIELQKQKENEILKTNKKSLTTIKITKTTKKTTKTTNNKKQKEDEVVNEDIEIDLDNLGDLDIDKLQKVSPDQLLKIAQSIGLQGKESRLILIEKVLNLISSRKEWNEKHQLQLKDVPFNNRSSKTLATILEIDHCESLFWKIFRNKFIYKSIMSKMYTHLSTPYDSIINVSKMIKLDRISMLIDKVKSNKYLIFECEMDSDKKWVFQYDSILSKVKNDQEFYLKLFKNYGQHIINFKDEIEINQLFEKVLSFDNTSAYQVLVNEVSFGINEDLDCFKLIFEYGAINIFNQFLKSTNFKLDANQFDSILLSLQPINPFDKNEIKMMVKRYEIIIQLLLPIGFSKIKLSKTSLFKQCPLISSFKLVDLINAIKVSNIISPLSKKNLSILNDNTGTLFTEQELNCKLTHPINQFSKYNTNILNLLKLYYSISNLPKDLKELSNSFLKLYYTIGGNGDGDQDNSIDCIKFYKLFQSILKSNDDKLTVKQKFKANIKFAKIPFRIGNYQLLKQWLNLNEDSKLNGDHEKNGMLKSIHYIYTYKQDQDKDDDSMEPDDDILFYNCNNQQVKTEFLNSICIDIIVGKDSGGAEENSGNIVLPNRTITCPKLISPTFLFYITINYNDIGLIKFVNSKLGNHTCKNKVLFYNSGYFDFFQCISLYIKSNDVLDYLYKECKEHFENSWIFFQDLQLLKHFESIVDQSFIPLKMNFPYQRYATSIPMPIIRHTMENPNIYQCNLCILDYLPLKVQENEALSLSKHIILNTTLNYSTRVYNGARPVWDKVFCCWLYQRVDKSEFNDTGNGRLHLTGASLTQFYYTINQFEQYCIDNRSTLFTINLRRKCMSTCKLDHVIDIVAQYGDIHAISIIVNLILEEANLTTLTQQQSETVDRLLLKLIERLVNYGQLNAIQFIQFNYCDILRCRSNKSCGWYTNDEFKYIILSSLKKGYIQMSEYLLQFFQITNKELILISSGQILNYFKNK